MNDEFYMRRALDLAKKGWGRTSPNPMVGAVIVKDGRIIGEGWHHRDGQPHAEIECLASCTESPEGSTIYVTLEPCTTHGRTGACSDAIIAAKIKSVKAGAIDPNPLHSGRAKSVFESAGIRSITFLGHTLIQIPQPTQELLSTTATPFCMDIAF